MDFFNSVKDFLGLSTPRTYSNGEETERNQFFSTPHTFSDSHQENTHILDEQSPRHFSPRGFSVFSDPLEMHKYFEHQMSEMLKSFGFQQFDDGNSLFDSFSVPAIDGLHIEEGPQHSSDDIRSQYLKPGYEKPPTDYQNEGNKLDTDVDGKLSKRDLDSLFGGHGKEITSFQGKPSIRTFGQSITTKTVQHPDGSIETHRTVRDNDGNEETTITKRLGNQEYSVIRRRNKNGEEENVENVVNMDEKDLEKFKKLPSKPVLGDADNKPPNWFLFDKFFK